MGMGWGGARPGAGRPALSKEKHLLRGTWRPERGPKPASGAVVPLVPTATPGAWAPDAQDLAALGPAGRRVLALLFDSSS